MVLLEVSIVLISLFVAIILTWFRVFDADISVTFAEKYGMPISVLRGKVAWIVGCASGIGEALAYELASNGVRLVLTDIKKNELQQVRINCLDRSKFLESEDIMALPFDITDSSAYENNMNQVLNQLGQVDIVFHNAGCSQRADFMDISSKVDRTMFEVNVFGHVAFARHILRHFLSRGSGHFVVTSSILGKCAFPRAATYVATKHALIGYFEAIRAEYQTKNITVTICCPAHVFSNLYDKCFTEEEGKFFSGGMKSTDRRMTAERCAKLMAVGAANKLEEIWLSVQPTLIGFYVCQYAPTFFKRVISRKFCNTEVADEIRDGRKIC